jgi:hypothetical protein
MLDFLENILRYPRFFISSLIGLISVLISPLISFFKLYPNNLIKILFLVFLLFTLILTLNNMLEI